MRFYYAAIVIALLFAAAIAYDTRAQTNYVLCESPVTGDRQVFPGLSCPAGWVFIRIVM